MKTPVDDMTALLLALPLGKTMWMRTRGVSMRPLLRTHDSIRVLRCEKGDLRPGDIAVLQDENGLLRAHLVKQLAPFVTTTFSGKPDEAGLRVLGKASAYQRGSQVVELTGKIRVALRAASFVWANAVRARSAVSKTILGRWAQSPKTRIFRNAFWGPVAFQQLTENDLSALMAVLPIHVARANEDISALLPPKGKSSVVYARGAIRGVACATLNHDLKYLFVTPLGRGLGWEKRLLEEIDVRPDTRHNRPR